MPLKTGHLRTGSLADKAQKLNVTGGNRAVAALKKRQQADKQRAADARARDKADLARRREIRKDSDFDLFKKKEVAAEDQKHEDEKHQDEKRPLDEQQPKKEGSLEGRLVGSAKVPTVERLAELDAEISAAWIEIVALVDALLNYHWVEAGSVGTPWTLEGSYSTAISAQIGLIQDATREQMPEFKAFRKSRRDQEG